MFTKTGWSKDTIAKFWERFYQADITHKPSPFAEYCLPMVPTEGYLLELGCGNGRDAQYFASNEISVIACDQCPKAVEKISKDPNIEVIIADFSDLGDQLNEYPISSIYSRFSLHAVDQDSASKALKWSAEHLVDNGKLFIEARSIYDEFYGKGEPCGRDAFIDDHYRRFLRQEELEQELKDLGFELEASLLDRDFAPFGDENPIIIRMIGVKSGG